VLVISQDGDNEEIASLVRGIRVPSRVIHLRHHRPWWSLPSLVVSNEYATSANVKFLLTFAFEHLQAPAAVVLESDLVPSVDFVQYFAWAFHHFFLSPEPEHAGKALAVSSFNMHSRADADPLKVWLGRFEVWGWGTVRERWPLIKAGWTPFQGWDGAFQRLRIREKLYVVVPALSRVRNIGMQGENFKVTDPGEIQRWRSVYIAETPVDLSLQPKVAGYIESTQVYR